MSNRLINGSLVVILSLAVLLTVATIYNQLTGGSGRLVIFIYLGLFGIGACLAAFLSRSRRLKIGLLYVFYLVIAVELLLQGTACLGWLPRLSIHAYVPYARVYFTTEGYSSGIMNRYGWHYPRFKLDDSSRRVVLIDDSFVAAFQVASDENMGAALERISEENEAPEDQLAVMSLGRNGAGPAQYLELLRYAIKYFQPQEAIIAVCLHNDFRNVDPARQLTPPDKYIYYLSSPQGPKLYPPSAEGKRAFVRQLEQNHRGLFFNLPRTLREGLLTARIIDAIKYHLALRSSQSSAGQPEAGGAGGEDFEPEPLHPTSSVQVPDSTSGTEPAEQLVFDLLDACRQEAEAAGVRLRLMTVLSFTPDFYEQADKTNWTSWPEKLGRLDKFRRERPLIEFAEDREIPILAMGQYILADDLTGEDVYDFYCSQGFGHLSVKGHEYFGRTIWDSFYAQTE